MAAYILRRLMLVIPTLLLTVGVVYCQMHYAVDAATGLLVPIPIALLMRRSDRLTV